MMPVFFSGQKIKKKFWGASNFFTHTTRMKDHSSDFYLLMNGAQGKILIQFF
jgi:hypothetical protein